MSHLRHYGVQAVVGANRRSLNVPLDDAMMMSTPSLWPGKVCCVKRYPHYTEDSRSMENFGYIREANGIALPRVYSEAGTTILYDSMDELIAAGWIVD